jgi:putative salt-induced outer membrane protein YdiY
MHPYCASNFRILALWLLASNLLLADTVDTKDGSRFVGKVLTIDAGVVSLDTKAAGTITIKQTEVVAISTDQPLSIRLDSGTRVDGTVSTQGVAVQIAGPDGHITTTIPKLVQSWPVGGRDPAAGHWDYEATVDISGTSGNKTQLGTAAGISAKRISPQDELDLYANYNRQVAEGVSSADQFKAGIDYTSYVTPTTSWFVRDEAGFDRIMAIEFYETAAAGLGEALIKNDVDLLTARVGIAYRYDSYDSTPVTPTVSTAAADFELKNDFKNANWELEDAIVVLPSLSSFRNLIINQDSFFQIPLKNPAWKLRLGFSNEYVSEPPAGIKKLDTTYYTRLILDWGQ